MEADQRGTKATALSRMAAGHDEGPAEVDEDADRCREVIERLTSDRSHNGKGLWHKLAVGAPWIRCPHNGSGSAGRVMVDRLLDVFETGKRVLTLDDPRINPGDIPVRCLAQEFVRRAMLRYGCDGGVAIGKDGWVEVVVSLLHVTAHQWAGNSSLPYIALRASPRLRAVDPCTNRCVGGRAELHLSDRRCAQAARSPNGLQWVSPLSPSGAPARSGRRFDGDDCTPRASSYGGDKTDVGYPEFRL